MVRVRFAPSPTGSLHLGNALTAVANRRFADEHGGLLVLRIDDTDPTRQVEGAEAGIVADLEWLGVGFEEGPIRQSERASRYAAAAERLLVSGAAVRDQDGAVRFAALHRPTLLRADGRATYQLASVVDDVELEISHVIRAKDHLPNLPLQLALIRALGVEPPQVIHHGLLLTPEGGKLSKRGEAPSLADLREQGVPAEAVQAYLDELDMPKHDVRLDLARLQRLAIEAIGALPDAELAARVGVPLEVVPALRGARDLVEARAFAQAVLALPQTAQLSAEAAPTLARFRELLERGNGSLDAEGARAIVRELKAVGGDLRALRLALTGAERGPELWAVVLALPREEALRRLDAAL